MVISFAEHALEQSLWASYDEMRARLMRCKEGHLILGEKARQLKEFCSLTVCREFAGTSMWGIGLCSEGHGLKPHMLLMPEKKRILFGLNEETVCVDVEKMRVIYRIGLDSLFRRFVYLQNHQLILVFHEIGVLSINDNGDLLWTFSKDIIQASKISDGKLFLEFMDQPPVTLAITDGKHCG